MLFLEFITDHLGAPLDGFRRGTVREEEMLSLLFDCQASAPSASDAVPRAGNG